MSANNNMYAAKSVFSAVLVISAVSANSVFAQTTSSIPDIVPQATQIQGQFNSNLHAPYPVVPHGPSVNLRNGFGPTATEADTDATTVPVEETRRRTGVAPAPRTNLSPTATDSERNATTVHETQRRTGIAPAPRIGSEPAWYDPS